MKLVTVTISEEGNLAADLGPGLHGARCAQITTAMGELGTVTKDIWKQERNCSGNCAGCESDYRAEKARLVTSVMALSGH
jgi:hypothetical protein